MAGKPGDGEQELKPMEDTFVNETDKLVHVTFGGETVTTTPEHPFYMSQKGWTLATDLRTRDRLQLVNGEYVVVEQVQHELLEAPIKVYNFRVVDNHTYYPGNQSILVHNANCGNASRKLAPNAGKYKGKARHSHPMDVYNYIILLV